MADIILHRRSFDTGSVPTTHSLGIAQFAINVPDGKVFIHKSSSVSESIVSVVTTDSITTGSITLTETASAALFIGTFTGSMIGNITNADTSSVAFRLDTPVQNKTGFTIPKGKVVRISGSVGDNPLVTTASYIDDSNSANTLGLTLGSIANDGSGSVITNGILTGINTSGMTAGQLLYLGPTGSYTTTVPVAPLHSVRLGEVLRVHASQGSIYVRIDNGAEIGELHDVVDSTTTASFGDVLTKSGSVWINSKTLTGSYGLSGSITMWQSASVSGANLIGTASQAETASFANSGFTINSSSIFSLATTSSAAGLNSFSIATGSSRGSILSYTATSQSNGRTGQVMTSWAGSNIVFNETHTPDIGNTSGVSYTSSLSGINAVYTFGTANAGWNLEFIVTHI